MSVVSAFTSAILPIVAIAAVGYAIGRRIGVGVDGLNAVALNFFLPALVFHGVATTDLSGRTVLLLAGAVDALGEVFRLPLVYAVGLAAALRWFGLVPPVDGTFMTTVDTVGSAAVPLMLTVVGIQLAAVDLGALRGTAIPAGLKLVVAPVVGAGVALAAGFDDPRVANVFVLECATPAAVTPLALALAYGDDAGGDALSTAEYMSGVIFVTTLLSVVVLTALVAAIRRGLVF